MNELESSKRYRLLSELGSVLAKKIRHLDPERSERREWDELSEDERDFYESCAETLVCERDLITQVWTLNDQHQDIDRFRPVTGAENGRTTLTGSGKLIEHELVEPPKNGSAPYGVTIWVK